VSLPSTIAIDGLAGSGKSTIGALLAEALDYLYFDTGVMYRAVTWAVLRRGIDPADGRAVSRLAETLRLDVLPNGPNDGRQYTVLADGQDVTWAIREPEVDAKVSLVSSYPGVRTVLTEQQRRIAGQGAVVMVGRDIGTVVLPEADLKVFLTASTAERAHRRFEQVVARGEPANLDAIHQAIIERDRQDQNNPVSPARPAADAVILDTTGLTIAGVLAQLQSLINEATGAKSG
jgi:cytidylate kinase